MQFDVLPSLVTAVVILSLLGLAGSIYYRRNYLQHRRKAHQKAKDNNQRFQSILHNSHDAFVLIDDNSRVIFWNDQAERLFGWQADEAVGKTLEELIIPASHHQAHREGMTHFLETGEASALNKRLELPARHKSGKEFPIEATIGTSVNNSNREFFAFMHDITERMEANQRLVQQAQYDALTSLPNRLLFMERLEQAMLRCQRHGHMIALMYLDVDHFKTVNDSLGHLAGDELLQRFAKRLKNTVRAIDTVARLGGDEFTILVESLNTREDALVVAEKLVANAMETIESGDDIFQITASVGISTYSGEAMDSKKLMVKADQALYQAKRAGRNRYQLATETEEAVPEVRASEPDPESAPQQFIPTITGSASSLASVLLENSVTPLSGDHLLQQIAGRETLPLDDFLQNVLAAVRHHLEMDVAFISEFTGNERVFRYVDSGDNDSPITVGDSGPLEESYCQKVVDGRLPERINDAFDVPEAMTMPVTQKLPVRGHISVPIRFRDNRLYGTFCCFSSRPSGTLNDRDLDLMRALATLAGHHIESLLSAEQRYVMDRASIQSILSEESLETLYQPVYDLRTQTVAGLEVLSYFTGTTRMSPREGFELANRVGLGISLELMAIRHGMVALSKLPAGLYLSFNVSPETVLSGELQRIFEGNEASRCVLEIRESHLQEDTGVLQEALQELHSQGVRLAVDDFAGESSSLQCSLRFRPAMLKQVMSLTRDIDSHENESIMTAAMASFSAQLDCPLVAKGVETREEMERLAELGVTHCQGWLPGPPMPLEEVVAVVLSRSPQSQQNAAESPASPQH